jgi:magnesium-transporting ATPase (P-type)
MSPFVIARTIYVAVLMAAGAVGLFLIQYAAVDQEGVQGWGYREAQTEAVTTVIFFQMFYLLNCRSLKGSVGEIGLWSNPWIYLGIAVVLVLQVGFVYLPFMNLIFGTAPLDVVAWLEAAVAGFLIMPIIALEKWWRRRGAKSSR